MDCTPTSGANPDFGGNELLYQLQETNPRIIIVHPDALSTAIAAATDAHFPLDRIVLFDTKGSSVSSVNGSNYTTVNQLVEDGRHMANSFVERRLKKGEGKTKLAFLSFSSGTTGKPKVCSLTSYAVGKTIF